LIAGPANADSCIVMRNGAGAISSAYYIFTRVIHWGCLADIALKCKSFVTYADWPHSTDSTAPLLTTVDPCAYICSSNASVANTMVAFVTYTKSLVVSGYNASAIVTAGDGRTWIRDAVTAISTVALVTYTEGLVSVRDYTRTIVTTVSIQTWVRNTVVAIDYVALVTYTKGLIVAGDYTGTVVAAIGVCTWVRDALVIG
jgi:hypothetical protein